MEAVGEMDGERVCHFIQAFLFSDTHPHPRIVYQHQQMTDKVTAQLQTGPHQDRACVFVLHVLEWLTQVLTREIMPCHCFARSAYPHSDDQMLQC